ncbi:hypothetical protein V5O48_008463 [Marasmius crinis-equi]|uniref:Uncharacterized protein n=1 Tax=Marasmius crinis-equi TaxID=585013 RepID=A0ABR3FDZ2_9AGAR
MTSKMKEDHKLDQAALQRKIQETQSDSKTASHHPHTPPHENGGASTSYSGPSQDSYSPAPPNNYQTHNHGNYNQTYNDSLVRNRHKSDRRHHNGTVVYVNSPCQVINKFALALISNTRPALLDTGCMALSHDDDWISVVKDSESKLPEKIELIRRISSTFKFVVQQDTIYPESMSDLDKQRVQRSLSSTTPIESENVITALVEVREPEVVEEGLPGGGIPQTVILEPEYTSGTSPSLTAATDDLGPFFVERAGRIFSSHPKAPYPLPSDPPEHERLDEQHEILKQLLGGNYIGPIHDVLTPDPERRLIAVDIGTG